MAATKPDTVITDTGDVVDVETSESPALTTASPAVYQPGTVSIYQSNDPEEQLREAQARAAVLVKVIQDQGLSRTFGNSQKPHVYVEGWQFLASQFGLIPDIEWSQKIEDVGKFQGWEARAVLRRLADGAEIAHADAECRNDETNWKNRPSYAIRSMAQTRAVSKVCRVALSSVMVMAGYAATPAEEMAGYDTGDSGSYSRVRASTAASPAASKVGRSDPKTTDDPHCPACLDNLGVLVGVTGPHDKKPYWRCTAKPEDCGGHRTHNGKDYSWSGWHNTWDNSARDFRGQPIIDNPTDTVISGADRTNRSGYIVDEIMALTGIVNKPDAEILVKPALIIAIDEGAWDVEALLGGPPGDPLSDDELRVIATNLTLTEADEVIATAAELAAERTGA